MKKVLSIVLALVMALSAVSITVFAADEYAEFDGTITLGETRPVNLPGLTIHEDYVFIRFIPERDGLYAISSDSRGNADSDPCVELYTNIDSTYIAKNDDANSETDEFYLEYNFKAGMTYYFAMRNFRDATVWDITLKCLHAEYDGEKCVSCDAVCNHEKVNNLFNSCPCGKTSDKEITLTDGKFEAEVENEKGKTTFYKFAPEKTGIYRIKSNSENKLLNKHNPLCKVYDLQENVVAYHDDISTAEGKENYNFDVVYKFEAGKVYFIGLSDAESDKKWSFTFEDISTHSFEIEVPVEDDETTTPDDETTVVTEGDTNTDANEGDTTTPDENKTTTITVVHELTFVPQVFENCYTTGCTGYATCEQCENYEVIGKYTIERPDHVYDEDGKCMTEGCNKVDPVLSCTHMCHSKGIMGTIWSIVKFFNQLFGSNKYCSCGVAHY